MNETFCDAIGRLSIGPSKIQGKGAFVAKGNITKNEVIGFYEGIITDQPGPYVMYLFGGADARRVNADPKVLGHDSVFAMVNEDLYGGIPNMEVLPSGLFRAIRDIKTGEELVIRYGKQYNWDFLKEKALESLSKEIASKAPTLWRWIPKKWADLKKKQDRVSRWVTRLVEGKLTDSSLHSSSNWEPLRDPREELVRLLTHGPTARKFNFRIWGRENPHWRTLPMSTNKIQRAKYASIWNGKGLMDIPFEVILEDSGHIREFNGRVKAMDAPRVDQSISENPDVQANAGGIKLTLNLGNRRLKLHLEQLNKLRSRDQIRVWARESRIWKVFFKNNPADDEYPGRG